METSNQNNDKTLADLSNEIAALNERMSVYLENINLKSDYYRNCVS